MINQNKPDELQWRKPNFWSEVIYIYISKVKLLRLLLGLLQGRRDRWTFCSRKVEVSLLKWRLNEYKVLVALDNLFHIYLFWWQHVQISNGVYTGTWEILQPECCKPSCLQMYQGSCLAEEIATSRGQLFIWNRLDIVQLQMPSFCLLFLSYFTIACLLDLRDK